MTYSSVCVDNIYVRPCVDGNSSNGEYFNFSISVSSCNADNCTALNALPGASMVSPIILSLTGISGQIASLIYLHRSSRPSSHRTTFYVMLTTLIWTDLIGKMITTPLPVMSYVYGHWVGGAKTCYFHGYAMSLIGIVTHLLVALMALERYLGIRCGYFYNRNVTTSRTRIILISIWLFGLIYCSLPFLGIGEFKLHYPGSWCHINQHLCWDHPLRNKVFSNLYTSMNLFCLFLIVFCNFVVVGTLLKMRVTKYRPSTSCRQMAAKKPREREIQMVILLVIITITFIFSWAPHDLLMIKNQIWPPPPYKNPILDMQAIRLVSINQIVDPWSYIICRIIFRSKLWGCCRTIIIGKIGSRRFGSNYEREDSSNYSVNGPKPKFFSAKMDKRSSLPNPAEMKIYANRAGSCRAGDFQPDNRRSYGENSLDSASTSDRECKVDINSCFTSPNNSKVKSSLISSTLAKWVFCPSKFNLRRKKENINPDKIKYITNRPCNHGLISLPDKNNIERENSPISKKLLRASFHDKSGHKKGKLSCGNINVDEDCMFPLLQGLESSSKKVIKRSNSWCCPSEYSAAFTRTKENPRKEAKIHIQECDCYL